MPRGISSLRKRPITSPWPSVLTSSPGITIRFAPAGELDGLERAAEDVVVGDRDRAEALALSAWSSSSSTSIEQSCDHDVCMCRSATIQSRSASGGSVGAGACAGAAERRKTARARRRRRRRSCPATPRARFLGALRRGTASSSTQPRRRRGGELGLVAATGRRGDRAPPRPRLERDARAARRAPARRSRRRRGSAPALPSRAVRTCTRPRSVARDRRPAAERLRPQQDELPVGQLAQGARARRGRSGRSVGRHSSDDELPLLRRARTALVSTPCGTIR